ncbi:MAG: hypothetical protein SFZ24_09650 [Planctomycetota bacterium]|nr:hypothetical protein [Planctomycetota bacterium]
MTTDQTRRPVLLRRAALGALAALTLSAGCAPPKPDTSGAPTASLPASAAGASASGEGTASAGGARFAPAILSREPWRYTTADGEIIRTPNYRLYSTTEDRVMSARLAGFLEHALAHYRTAIVPLPAPTQRLDTYLMANRPQWERLTQQLMGPQAEALLKIPRGGYASRGIGVFYNIGLFDTLAIAGHEGWHQYTQRVFNEPLPVWLEEGMATYMEGHRWEENTPVFRAWANVQRFNQLRTARNEGKLMPLDELLDGRPQDFLQFTDQRVLTFYAQLWALVHFLNEGEGGKYRAGLHRVIADASAGTLNETVTADRDDAEQRRALASRTGPGVFLTYFNADLSTAQSEYSRFVDQITQTGAATAIGEGRSPVAPSVPR